MDAAEASHHHTPSHHIEAARQACAKIEAEHPEVTAQVDDWGRFSNFSVFVGLRGWDRTRPIPPGTTKRLRVIVLEAFGQAGAHIRAVFPPEPRRQRGVFAGYNHAFWGFDIDYQRFDAHTNSFQG